MTKIKKRKTWLEEMNDENLNFFCQLEPEDLDDGDPGYTARPKRVVKPKSHRGRAKKESQNQQPLSCKHCRKTFTKLLQLKAHQAVHGANTEKPFHCSQCGRGFSFQRSLNAHMLLHTGECVTSPYKVVYLFVHLINLHRNHIYTFICIPGLVVILLLLEMGLMGAIRPYTKIWLRQNGRS